MVDDVSLNNHHYWTRRLFAECKRHSTQNQMHSPKSTLGEPNVATVFYWVIFVGHLAKYLSSANGYSTNKRRHDGGQWRWKRLWRVSGLALDKGRRFCRVPGAVALENKASMGPSSSFAEFLGRHSVKRPPLPSTLISGTQQRRLLCQVQWS
jgi:hypothetical protein